MLLRAVVLFAHDTGEIPKASSGDACKYFPWKYTWAGVNSAIKRMTGSSLSKFIADHFAPDGAPLPHTLALLAEADAQPAPEVKPDPVPVQPTPTPTRKPRAPRKAKPAPVPAETPPVAPQPDPTPRTCPPVTPPVSDGKRPVGKLGRWMERSRAEG